LQLNLEAKSKAYLGNTAGRVQSTNKSEAMDAIMDFPDGATPGASLNDRMQEHQDHLAALMKTLRMLGLAEGAIHEHVTGIIEEYRMELRHNLDRIV
jgi:hypothetical protein